MSKRTKWLLGIGVIAALVIGWQIAAFATHAGTSLTGSNFEIDGPPDGANLIVDHATGTKDWASVPHSPPPTDASSGEVRKIDEPTGKDDDSFGEGTKEDDGVPTVVSGRIPNNKSDLKTFGVYLETTATGQQFLNMFWHRVQEPTGTTNMDFEFNQSKTLSSNNKTPVRTAGDLLIQYDLASGGTHPELFLSTWIDGSEDPAATAADCEAANSLPCWSEKENLSGQGLASGSINTTSISSANSDGLGAISSRTFGEAQVDFDAIVGGSADSCTSFGSAYLKSRSSDSFTSAIKDFIAPANLNLSNCAKVTIRKETVPDGSTQSFTFTHNLKTDPPLANLTTFQLTDGQNFSNSNVLQNTVSPADYSVKETIPANWDLSSIDCAVAAHPSSGVTINKVEVNNKLTGEITFDINSNTDVVDCTYNNQQRITTMNTTQKVFPNDTASVTGSGTPTGNVTFQLYGPDTPGSTTDDKCTVNTGFTQTVALAPDPNNANQSIASTTNGDGVGSEFAILDATEGTYWWKVSYAGDGNNPAVLNSCRESTLVTIDNDGAATSTTP